MKKYWIKLLDRNKNKKVDWYEVLFPTPDINKNKQVDWWEALIGIVFFIGFWGTVLVSMLFLDWLVTKLKIMEF
jgi:hypothetical protein